MKCPKCQQGDLVRIRFKTSDKTAFLCNACDVFWFETEDIKDTTGHILSAFYPETEKGYLIEELSDVDQEHEKIIGKDKDSL